MKDLIVAQANIISIVVWMIFIALLLRRYDKRKASTWLFVFTAIVFYAFSTAWFPRYLAYCMETKYPILKEAPRFNNNEKIYIHVLGSGYSTNDRLPASGKLCLVAKGRLMEAIRLYRMIPNSILVCSADGPKGQETQAMVARAAAMEMGADSSRILALTTPSTTKEEAQDLAKAVGTSANVIVVTDAIHIPRAMRFFKEAGFSPIAAPTNFKALEASERVQFKWWPSDENIYITNRLLHEYFASVKAAF